MNAPFFNVRSLLYKKPFNQTLPIFSEEKDKVVICVDSQAALKALDSLVTKYKKVKACKKELNEAGKMFDIRLVWVPGHSNVQENE